MTIEDELKLQIGAYYGVMSMDNYDLKEFVLKDIEEYINCFVKENNIACYRVLFHGNRLCILF